MNKVQVNRLEMYRATIDFLESNRRVWGGVPVTGRYKNDLNTAIDGIRDLAEDQEDARVFLGQSLTTIKRTIGEKMDILDDLLEAYAIDVENDELQGKAANSKSDYIGLTYEKFEIKVKQVIELLEQHAEDMLDYGMTIEQLDDVKLDFDRFMVMRGKPRAYQVASVTATQSLDNLFDEAKIAVEKLDRVLKRYKRMDASFYYGYEAVRKIIDV